MKTNKRVLAVSVVSTLILGLGLSTANAAPQIISTTVPNSIGNQGTVKPQSIAVESGGSTSSSSSGPSVSDLLSQISAAARSAGGWGILAKTAQCIYNTARYCPECFTL
jgi:hypothetical protein